MRKVLTILVAAIMILAASGVANAGIVFDRGLPSGNLNNAAGSNRSNVAWADDNYADGVFVGDNFLIGGSGQTTVTSLVVWLIDPVRYGATANTTYTLWTGIDDLSVLSTEGSSALSRDYYPGTSSVEYQAQDGTSREIYKLTFDLNWTVDNDTVCRFGISNSDDVLMFVHASNAPLSVSTQEYPDDSYFTFNSDGTYNSTCNSGDSGCGWDKGSDINVQLFSVPEPATLALLGLGGLMLRRSKKA